jgi:hypothetical protein
MLTSILDVMSTTRSRKSVPRGKYTIDIRPSLPDGILSYTSCHLARIPLRGYHRGWISAEDSDIEVADQIV